MLCGYMIPRLSSARIQLRRRIASMKVILIHNLVYAAPSTYILDNSCPYLNALKRRTVARHDESVVSI